MSKPGSSFRDGSYRNNYSSESHGLAAALKAFWGARKDFKQAKLVRFAKAENDPAFLKANQSQATLTWVGHATFLLQVAGLNVLTDPVFFRRLPLRGQSVSRRWGSRSNSCRESTSC